MSVEINPAKLTIALDDLAPEVRDALLLEARIQATRKTFCEEHGPIILSEIDRRILDAIAEGW